MTQPTWIRRVWKPLVFGVCLTPALLLVAKASASGLGVNPIEYVTKETGTWTLRLLMATLAVTPLRRLTGWHALIRFRRMLGLFAFFYALLHFSTYVVLDQFFALDEIVVDVAKRPYITVGFTAFVLLIPLAVTSTEAWIRRLGRRWQHLHRLIYLSATAAVVHYLWLVKADLRRPLIYASILAVLLGLRLVFRGVPVVSRWRVMRSPAGVVRQTSCGAP